MSGLVAWYPLHGDGSTVPDLSDNGNHGTNNGSKGNLIGRGGLTGRYFDGSNDYIDLNFTSLSIPFTVSMWVKPFNHSTADVYFGNYNAGSDDIQIRGDSGGWRISGDNVPTVVGGSIDDGVYQHVTVTADSSETRVIKNAEVKATGSGASGTIDNGHFFSLNATHSNETYAECIVSDCRIYNRVLTDSEIETLHEWGTIDTTQPPTDGVAYYPLDGDATDSWGSKDGTNNGAGFSSDAIQGQAGYFGGNDYIELGDYDGFQDFPLSYSVWFKPDSISGSQPLLSKGTVSANPGGCMYLMDNGAVAWNAMNPATGDGCYQQQCNGGNIVAGTWNHAVGVWSGDNSDPLRLYINGVEVSSVTSQNNGTDPRAPLRIGTFGHDNSDYFSGMIDDARIYPYVLEPRQIHELYRWGTRGRDMRRLTVNA